VAKDKFLLVENALEVNGKKYNKEDVNAYITQRPNTRIKIPFSKTILPLKLWAYGWHNKDYKKKWDDKLLKASKSPGFFTKTFSLKQMAIYTDFRKKLNQWFAKNGESPVLLSVRKTKKTLKNLKLHYRSQGYFHAKINYRIDSLPNKKSKVTYMVTTGNISKIDSIIPRISSPVIDSLYRAYKPFSILKEHTDYKQKNLEDEANRLTAIFRNSGVYHFSKYAINFFEIDTLNTTNKTNIILDISDRLIEDGDSISSIPFQITHIKQVKIYTDYSYSKKDDYLQDSIHYKGLDFYAYNKINYKPKHLIKSIFIKPGDKYSDLNTKLTRKLLLELNSFKSIRINFEEVANNQLIAHILLTPSKELAFKTETEVTHQNTKPFGISGKISIKNRNTFKGNEILQFGLQGSFLHSTLIDENFFFGLNAWEWGVDASYKIPRLFIPFYKGNHAQNRMSPNTIFTIGYSSQKNIGLDKQRFTAIAKYNWKPSKKIQHEIEVLNAQYIENLNPDSFFDIYKSEARNLERIRLAEFPDTNFDSSLDLFRHLQEIDFQNSEFKNISKRYKIITEDILVPTLSYQFSYNTQKNFNDTDYTHFKISMASSGLLTTLFAKEINIDEPKQINGINISQYLKFDIEYKKYWNFNYHNILAFRTNIGVAIPYGNSSSIPFSRSYFVGGPNDMRAWKIYELGPGKENDDLEFKVGNFKLLSSLEYRFDIIASLKGALFVDAGNIWDATNSDLTSDGAKLNSFSALKNTAIGSGFGLRYDLSFLILRGDLGFKTYEPYKPTNYKWFNTATPVLNIGINYPF